jgi:signal transduction histidine kinase
MLKMNSDSFINYSLNVPGPEQLNNSSIMEICIQNDTMVWVGTQGLYLLNPESGTFKRYFKKDDRLYNSSVKGLLIENNSILWVATNQGICRYNFRNDTYKLFTKSDGLQSDESNFRSIIQLRDGSILAGGTKGFNQIFPDKITENKHVPNILLTDFQIFNKDVPIGIEDSPLTRHISETDKLVLSYTQTVLTFYFSAMDFTIPEKNQYAYMMENFDEDWIYCGNKREATYTNLDPGKYVFKVKGSNNDGYWNDKGISLPITILPPWWRTVLFKVLIFVTLISLIIGFYYYRISQLKKQKELLEKIVRERTKEIAEKNEVLHKQTDEMNEINTVLEERQQRIEEQSEELKTQAEELSKTNKRLMTLNATKDKFFSIIAHDLKNPFTSILGFCEILLLRYQKYDDTKRLHLINIINQSAENIFKLLENLLQWSRSQTGNIKFEPEEFLIIELINNNLILTQNMSKEKQLSIDVHVNQNCKVFADKNMVNTVIRNLLTNAVKFTEKGKIHITLEEDSKWYKMKIEDTGVGIPAEKLQNLFEIGGSKSTEGTRGETGTGLGLIICKEFIEKNGGEIGVESEVGKGSVFFFTLPKPVATK